MEYGCLQNLLEDYLKTHDEMVLNQLIQGYAPLCAAIARRFTGRGVEFDDLNQIALMALLKAIDRFEPERGLQFTTYLSPTIAGEIRHYIRDKGSAIRFSRDKTAQLTLLNTHREALTLSLKREPTLKELAQAMSITPYELLQLMQLRDAGNLLSMDAPMTDEEATALSGRLGQTEEGYEQIEDQDQVDRLLKNVTPQEKKLLELRFMEKLGQRETAKLLNISQMQVSRMERRVLLRLKAIAL